MPSIIKKTHDEREFVFTPHDFERIRKLIYDHAGIALSPKKTDMVYSRLTRRLREIGLSSFKDYLALVEEAAAAAESMQEQAKVLMEAVGVFKLETTGGAGGRQMRTAAKPLHTMAAPVHSSHLAHAVPRRAVSSAAEAAVKKIPKLAKAADGTEEWKEF